MRSLLTFSPPFFLLLWKRKFYFGSIKIKDEKNELQITVNHRNGYRFYVRVSNFHEMLMGFCNRMEMAWVRKVLKRQKSERKWSAMKT